jgi:hypothetical protein
MVVDNSIAGRQPPTRHCCTGGLVLRAKHAPAPPSLVFLPAQITLPQDSQPYYSTSLPRSTLWNARLHGSHPHRLQPRHSMWDQLHEVGYPPKFPILSMCVHTYVAAPEPCSLEALRQLTIIHRCPPGPSQYTAAGLFLVLMWTRRVHWQEAETTACRQRWYVSETLGMK